MRLIRKEKVKFSVQSCHRWFFCSAEGRNFQSNSQGCSCSIPSPSHLRSKWQHVPSLASSAPLRYERCLIWHQMGHRDDEIKPHRLVPEQFSALNHSHARNQKEPADGLAKPISGFTSIWHGALWLCCLLSWVVKDKCSNRLGLFFHSWAPLQRATELLEHFYGAVKLYSLPALNRSHISE